MITNCFLIASYQRIYERVPKQAIMISDSIQYGTLSIRSMKNPDGSLRFPRVSPIAKLILLLPHSNAEEQRVFSLVHQITFVFSFITIILNLVTYDSAHFVILGKHFWIK